MGFGPSLTIAFYAAVLAMLLLAVYPLASFLLELRDNPRIFYYTYSVDKVNETHYMVVFTIHYNGSSRLSNVVVEISFHGKTYRVYSPILSRTHPVRGSLVLNRSELLRLVAEKPVFRIEFTVNGAYRVVAVVRRG